MIILIKNQIYNRQKINIPLAHSIQLKYKWTRNYILYFIIAYVIKNKQKGSNVLFKILKKTKKYISSIF